MTAKRYTILGTAAALFASAASAQDMSAFRTGPIFEDFGAHAPVEGIDTFAPDTEFAIAFDVAGQADAGTRNRGSKAPHASSTCTPRMRSTRRTCGSRWSCTEAR